LFSGIAFERIVALFQHGMGSLPAEIPSWLDLILTGGTIGIIIFIILLVLGVNLVVKLAPFFVYLLIGILAALLINVVFPALDLPNPFDWILNILGAE